RRRPRASPRASKTLRPPPHAGGGAGIPRTAGTRVMAVRIEKKITGYSVAAAEGDKAAAQAGAAAKPGADVERPTAEVIQMHERIERPEVLVGSTYKIKSPLVEHAMYVTINDIVLNAGSEHEQRRPFEIFVNSK